MNVLNFENFHFLAGAPAIISDSRPLKNEIAALQWLSCEFSGAMVRAWRQISLVSVSRELTTHAYKLNLSALANAHRNLPQRAGG